MKINHIITSTAVLALLTLSAPTVTQASSYLSGKSYASQATHYVKTTKRVKVYRIHTGKYEAANRISSHKIIKKGTRLYRSSNIMSTGGWIVKSGSLKHSHRYFYMVPSGTKHWYKAAR
ncbi:hypothetical protein [Levilactobacillus bambusae]|uniref:Surface layer protein A domain-containing protein n=1 Tax=Levilactobacillus bambusae TaxID=2024736 RepID=A0A2V1N5Z5_9LACO|nr:hypothetical protein [Levilactobacillus bambusae]PWG00990.1 hypothetical protein DCM90_02110 [Levilactobacillus bambusae]